MTTTIGTTNSLASFPSTGYVQSPVGVHDPLRLLSGNVSNNTESNLTLPHGSSEGSKGVLPQWQIILITSLIAATLVIILALVLIWKFCGKKQQSPASGSPKSRKSGSSGLRSLLWCSKKKSNTKITIGKDALPKPEAFPRRPLSSDYQRDVVARPDTKSTTADFPSDHNAAVQGAKVLPRRLAPLTHNRVATPTTTNLASGGSLVRTPRRTGGVYAQLKQYQQNGQLKGVPVIPINVDQRRPLPPPPPLG